MKHIKNIIFYCLFIVFFYCNIDHPVSINAQSIIDIPKEMYDKKEVERDVATVIHLTNDDHLLEGLVDYGQFFYEVPVQGLKKDNYLHLTVEYSELLLEGSTVTVSVDDQPIKSVKLKPKKESMDLNIPLPEFALTEGFHDVQISFYGHILEDLCVNEESPANWLTISSSSYLYLNTNDLMKRDDVLSNYPYPFVQNNLDESVQGVIVVPDDTTLTILSAAFKLASYLNSEAVGDEKIKILTESEIDKISSHLIIIGTEDQFSANIRQLYESAKIKTSKDELTLSSRFLKVADGLKQALFVTATAADEKVIEEYISLLTEDQLIEQLAGNDLGVKSKPLLKHEEVSPRKSLKDLKLSHITLTGIKSMTENFFYTLPPYIDVREDATLNLKLNISDTLLNNEQLANKQKEEAELLVIINDIPHSIALEDLGRESFDGFYNIQVPVNRDTLQNQPYLAIQFHGLGLKDREICVPPSDDKWIFVHEDSFIQFNILDEVVTDNFKLWPAPFVSVDNKETIIVVPDELTNEIIGQMKELVDGLGSQAILNDVQFLFEKDLTTEILENNHLLFLGHLNILKEYDDLLIQQDEQGNLNVAEHGFLNETSKSVAWIQPSIWNEDNSLAIFSQVDQSRETTLSVRQITNYLKSNKTNMSIIVEGENGEVFTNKHLTDLDDDYVQEGEKQVEIDLKLVIAIITLFIIGLIVFIIVYRASRRSKHKE